VSAPIESAPDRPHAKAAESLPAPVGSGPSFGGLEGPSPRELAQRVEILEGSPVFCGLPGRILWILARRMQRMELPPGETVVDIGERDHSIYFVGAGVCESAVAVGVPSFALHRISFGESFGLPSAILEAPQPTTVTTIEPTVLFVVTSQAVRSTLDAVPGAIPNLERLAAQMLENYRQEQIRATSTLLPRRDAVIIPVYSASGGCGRTTIALNLAAALAADAPGRVLLIDLSLPYGHASLMANLIPSGSIATAARYSGPGLEPALMSAAIYHPAGMMVLPGVTRPEEAELVTPQVVSETLAALKDQFAYIVVDLAVPLTGVALTVFDHAQQVVLVLTPELGAVQGSTEALRILEGAFGIPPQLVTIVLNNRAPKPATSREAITQTLNRMPDIEIRYDGSRPDKTTMSGRLCFEDPRSSIRAAMIELVVRVNDLCVTPAVQGVVGS
jgi:Flp pilus assembly protein, ATPase CpaE